MTEIMTVHEIGCIICTAPCQRQQALPRVIFAPVVRYGSSLLLLLLSHDVKVHENDRVE